MTEFRYDHVHLRSPDPDATAAYYELMFGAKVIKTVMSNGVERTDMNLGGVMVFIAQARRLRIIEIGEREARQHQPETHGQTLPKAGGSGYSRGGNEPGRLG